MFVYAALFLASVITAPAPDNTVVCYAGSDAFISRAPAGWAADRKAGAENKVCVFYVLEGTTFDTSPVVMYPVANDEMDQRLPSGQVDIVRFIARDIARFKERDPNLIVKTRPVTKTRSGLTFHVRQFLGGPPPNEFEMVAYLAGGQAMLSLVYSARTKDDFDQYASAFDKLIQSMRRVPVKSVFRGLKKVAAADAKRPEARDFDVEFAAAIGQKVSEALRSCLQPGADVFNAIFQISSQGRIEEITLEEDSEMGRCFRFGMQGVEGPPPPFAPFHHLFDLQVRAGPGFAPADAQGPR